MVNKIRFWCNKVLPLVYDDSLSYYELLCKVVNKINEIIDTGVGISVADPIEWNITTQYPQNTIVVDADGTAYISKKPVPSGITLDNEDYWLVIFNYGDNINELRSYIAFNEGNNDYASQDHVKNTLVWVNGKLYKTLRNIVTGDRYVENSNIELVTVASMLNIEYDETDETLFFPNGQYTGEDNGNVTKIIVDNKSINIYDAGARTLIANETASRESADADILEQLENLSTNYVDPAEYGAVYDGTTDDTNAFISALEVGSIRLPSGVSTKLENLYVPDFREIDFNGSFVYTSTWAIKCIATPMHSYVRNITIKNAHFIPTTSHSNAHSGGGLYLDGAIKCNLLNSEMANPTSGTDLAYIKNSFNFTAENVYCGTGNNSRVANTSGIAFDMGNAIIAGSDNVTNCKVSNALFQHLTYGIFVDSNNGLFDSNLFDNIGCSNVGYGVYITGESSTSRNNVINTIRVEFSDNAIYNTGYLTIIGFYGTRISNTFITNSGKLTMVGDVAAYNTAGEIPLYNNTGIINASSSLPDFLSHVTLSNTGDITNPYVDSASDSNIFINNANDKMNKILSLLGMITITGTSGESGGEIVIPYPTGYSRDNTLILGCCIYASNGQYLYSSDFIFPALATSGIVINTSTSMTTTFNCPIYIFAMKRVF